MADSGYQRALLLVLTDCRDVMAKESDRRRHRRLPLKLAVFCRQVGVANGVLFRADAVNVSSGGVLIESSRLEAANAGDLFSLELAVPAGDDSLAFGGRFSGIARVVRAIEHGR